MLVTKGLPRGHLTAIIVGYALLLGTSIVISMTRTEGIGALATAIILVVILPMLLASSAKAPAKSVELPERHVTLETSLQPDAVFAKLAQLKFGKVAPHDVDAGRRVVVLSSPAAGMSYGHFYPVFVRGSGVGSIVEVGITPKSIDCKPRLEKALAACAAAIEKAIAA